MPPPRRWFIPLYLPQFVSVKVLTSLHLSSPPPGNSEHFLVCVSICFRVCVLSLFSVSNLTDAALSYYSLQKKQKPNRIHTSIWLRCIQFSNVCSSVAASGDPPADFCLEGSGTVVLCWDPAREVPRKHTGQSGSWPQTFPSFSWTPCCLCFDKCYGCGWRGQSRTTRFVSVR